MFIILPSDLLYFIDLNKASPIRNILSLDLIFFYIIFMKKNIQISDIGFSKKGGLFQKANDGRPILRRPILRRLILRRPILGRPSLREAFFE